MLPFTLLKDVNGVASCHTLCGGGISPDTDLRFTKERNRGCSSVFIGVSYPWPTKTDLQYPAGAKFSDERGTVDGGISFSGLKTLKVLTDNLSILLLTIVAVLHELVCPESTSSLRRLKFLVSRETVVLRGGRVKQKFGFIKRVDKGWISTVKIWKGDVSRVSLSSERNREAFTWCIFGAQVNVCSNILGDSKRVKEGQTEFLTLLEDSRRNLDLC